MQPPWIVYQHTGHGSIGWRMGDGEGYYNDFYRWFSDLGDDERKRFVALNPELEEWAGFYKMIEDSPWKSN